MKNAALEGEILMAEFIEREKALSAQNKAMNLSEMRERLKRIPAADVRPVVLCRDCKWTKTDGMDDPAIYCVQWDRWETPPDGFCWLGEKREES